MPLSAHVGISGAYRLAHMGFAVYNNYEKSQ